MFDHNNYDILRQDRNETDHQGALSCEGSTTCGEAEGFAGTKLTLANLPDGRVPIFHNHVILSTGCYNHSIRYPNVSIKSGCWDEVHFGKFA